MRKYYLNKKITYLQLLDLCCFYFLLLFMWLLFSGNTDNADYENYLIYYEFYSLHIFDGSWYPDLEKGFSLFMQVSNFLGLDYNQFLGVYAFVGLSLIANSIMKFSNFRFLPLFLYFIYQFFLDAVQIRNFMLVALFIFSLRYLIEWYSTKRKKSLVKYIIWILVSSQFHITGLFFLLLIFARNVSLKKLTFITISVTITLFIFKGYILNIFNSALTDTRYSSYLDEPTTFIGSILIVVYVLIGLFIIKQLNDIIKKESKSDFIVYFSEVTTKFNIFLILTIFLFSIRPDFIRIDRNIQILNYIMLVHCLKPMLISMKAKNLLSIVSFILFFIGSTYAFLWFSNIEGVVKPLLENNMYFK